jgi:hypothetical protein
MPLIAEITTAPNTRHTPPGASTNRSLKILQSVHCSAHHVHKVVEVDVIEGRTVLLLLLLLLHGL